MGAKPHQARPGLTAQQERFCAAYAQGGDAVAAYRSAYVTGRLPEALVALRAEALLRRPAIQAHLKAGRAESEEWAAPAGRKATPSKMAGKPKAAAPAPAKAAAPRPPRPKTKAALDKEWILGRLVENIERALPAGAAGEGSTARRGDGYNGAVVNRALELLGKELGMFREPREANEGGFSRLSDKALDRLIQRLLRETGLAAADAVSEEKARDGG